MNETERCDRVQAQLAEREVGALLVSAAANLRYLSGFTDAEALLVVTTDGERCFFTDFRYEIQAEQELPASFLTVIATDLLPAVAERFGEVGALGVDDDHLTVAQHRRLGELLGEGTTRVGCGGLVEKLRVVKDADELERIRAAAALIDGIYEWVLERGLVGRRERDVALELEHEMRRRGARAPSFPSIVAAGAHGALPHATPRDVAIEPDTLVTIDIGAELDGYCSDCTRTFASGTLGAEEARIYEVTLQAQLAGLEAVRAGRSGRVVDAAAREVIEQAGYGERFGHGLGHGVGLEVHERPRLSRTAPEDPLEPGMVVTVEPGIYLPGVTGVRIEDLVVVGEEGCERLSHFPKELIVAG
ncbi:MAG TPA: Xaa-Pro peptidase family protein [Solirubrobacteraceae bacterium]|jgi:Xaa-Pro aminopeptidase|nr:Xaa-Pro peptidase family protein [Solirubrobacteraceae bacterium]